MNAITLLSNQNAQALAEAQSELDTTAPVVNPNVPTADNTLSTPDKRTIAGNALFHTLFVGLFLFGGIMALGSLTGELDIDVKL